MSVVVLLLAFVASPSAQSHSRFGSVRMSERARAGYAVHPLDVEIVGYDAQGRPRLDSTTPYGYAPSIMAAYLGLSGDGTGQTIAIVDAYHTTRIRSDVNKFSSYFHLPLTCSKTRKRNCFHFTQLNPSNAKTNFGWALETSLDVEWAHAIAPKASIILGEAVDNRTDHLASMLASVARRKGVHVISNSYGGEEWAGETAYDASCKLATAVCAYASGDGGNPGIDPAYNPYALAIGGTKIDLDTDGTVLSEEAWKCPDPGNCVEYQSTGGGVSVWEPRPSYQDGFHAESGRGIPDVSAIGDPDKGVPVYDSFQTYGAPWFLTGGTSLATPVWSAILAVVDQLRAKVGKKPLAGGDFSAQNAIYGLSSGLFDVTVGTNGDCGAICTAGTGYDFVTGRGSPRAGVDAALASVP